MAARARGRGAAGDGKRIVVSLVLRHLPLKVGELLDRPIADGLDDILRLDAPVVRRLAVADAAVPGTGTQQSREPRGRI